jgi:GH25 family lysozyme M1 (1,4-beta-N-acetylmuramidase)
MIVRWYDVTGVQRDEAWLAENYGNVSVTVTSATAYGQVDLRESLNGSTALMVTCRNRGGAALVGKKVIFGWPDGSVSGVTESNGAVGFGMGGGAYYRLPASGPHYIETGGVRVAGLGMKWGTNHDHLDAILTEQAPEPPPDPLAPARGFYVCYYQGVIAPEQWAAIKRAGYSFVHIRATHGQMRDPHFARNWDNAGEAGLLRSVWHYLTPYQHAQAALFRTVVGDRVPELGWYGDFEEGALTLSKCQQFLDALDKNFGIHAGIYTSARWLNARGTPNWGDRNLWIAHWTTAANPALPRAWTKAGRTWEFWQHAGGAWNDLVKANVLYDRFHGTEAELRKKYGTQPELRRPEPSPPGRPLARGREDNWGKPVRRLERIMERLRGKAD